MSQEIYQCIYDLEYGNQIQRTEAARRLIDMGTEAEPILSDTFRSASPILKQRILTLLSDIQAPKVIPGMIEFIEETKESHPLRPLAMRVIVNNLLSRHRSKILDFLLDCTLDKDPYVRSMALEALIKIGDFRDLRCVEKALVKDSALEVRQKASLLWMWYFLEDKEGELAEILKILETHQRMKRLKAIQQLSQWKESALLLHFMAWQGEFSNEERIIAMRGFVKYVDDFDCRPYQRAMYVSIQEAPSPTYLSIALEIYIKCFSDACTELWNEFGIQRSLEIRRAWLHAMETHRDELFPILFAWLLKELRLCQSPSAMGLMLEEQRKVIEIALETWNEHPFLEPQLWPNLLKCQSHADLEIQYSIEHALQSWIKEKVPKDVQHKALFDRLLEQVDRETRSKWLHWSNT